MNEHLPKSHFLREPSFWHGHGKSPQLPPFSIPFFYVDWGVRRRINQGFEAASLRQQLSNTERGEKEKPT